MELKQLNNLECPNCGGTLEQVHGDILECPYCGSRFENPNAKAKPASIPAAPAKPAAPSAKPSVTRSKPMYAKLLEMAVSRNAINPQARHIDIGREAVQQDSYRYMCAKTNFGIPDEAICCLLYTDGLNYCDKGFALCDTGVHFCAEYGPEAGKPLHLSWLQFTKLPLHTQGSKLFFGQNGFHIYEETGADPILNLLESIQSRM